MSAWQESRRDDAMRIADAVTAAARAGDHRGVQALLDKASSRSGAAQVVTYAVALTDQRFAEFRESSRRFADAGRAQRARSAEHSLSECVAVLAEAMGVTRDDIEAERQKRLGKAKPRRDTAA